MLSFSVIVNTYNRAQSLRRTLEGLTLLDYPLFEVIVINGPSTDGTEEVLAEFAGRIKVGHLQERNLSMSRNLGIAAAAGDLVAFIDDDAYPDPGWLDCLAAAYDRDEVAGAGGPTYDHTGYALQAHISLATRTGGAWIQNHKEQNRATYLNRPFTNIFPYTIGTNSCFRRSSLIEIGGFDEEFDYYLDETDVCLRLIDRGYVVRALDDGFVYHKFLASDVRTQTRSLRDRFSVLKNRVYFAMKNGSGTVPFLQICRDLVAFVEHHRRDFRWNVQKGLLSQQDLQAFEADVPRAFDVGLARFRAKESRTRAAEWFADGQTPFLLFATRRPVGRKLHLCFLSMEYPPGVINGIARFTHEMARGLAERGHHVHVLTRGEQHHRVDLEDGVWVHRIVPSSHRRPDRPLAPQGPWDYSASLYDEILRIHRHRALDLLEAPLWDSEGIAAILGGAVPVAVSLHTPLPAALEISPHWGADPVALENHIKPLIALERFCLERCAAILANSQAIVDEIERGHGLVLDPTRYHIVPHGYGNGAAVPSVRDPGDEGIEVLFVGRLELRKGIDVLLDSIAPLLARFPQLRFTIAGDDRIASPHGPTWRQLFESRADVPQARVRFTGRVADAELERLYAACDIFAAPSRYESFGLIFIEAMACAKPVIGCDAGGMREVVMPGENGFLVPPGDAGALTAAIAQLAGSAELRACMGRRSREIYEQRFTRGIMAAAAEQFYTSVAERRGAPDETATRERAA